MESVEGQAFHEALCHFICRNWFQGESDSDWTKRVKRMAVTAVDTVSRINTAQTVRDSYASRSMAATAASNLRKPELQSKVSDSSDWLRSVETWVRAQHCDLPSPDTVAMVETYLSAATARRWTQRKAVLARDSKPITFAELRNCVLTSPDGMHPANASRTAFIDLKYNAAKSLLDNLTTYRQLYDTMVLTCEHTRICTLQGYELYEHFMHFMHSGVRSIYSVILTSAQAAIVAHENGNRFVNEDQLAKNAFYTVVNLGALCAAGVCLAHSAC